MCFHWVVKHFTSNPYYPKGNQNLKACLTIFYNQDHNLWDQNLEFIDGFNSAIHDSTRVPHPLPFLGCPLSHPLFNVWTIPPIRSRLGDTDRDHLREVHCRLGSGHREVVLGFYMLISLLVFAWFPPLPRRSCQAKTAATFLGHELFEDLLGSSAEACITLCNHPLCFGLHISKISGDFVICRFGSSGIRFWGGDYEGVAVISLLPGSALRSGAIALAYSASPLEHYYATSDGKGVIDEIGGNVKRLVSQKVMSKGEAIVVQFAEKFTHATSQLIQSNQIYYVEEHIKKECLLLAFCEHFPQDAGRKVSIVNDTYTPPSLVWSSGSSRADV
ncbi:hypothetical protein PR048_011137 [Dryococelus australis]|uniref:Uncharacterized protein n=1 Tax=Dryococelus australis TaxID=614101 RepID=A0ABQ9HKQ1_9NEOP|nr:hypothetical protein PR048_011137 [Dryococelus australis]